MKKLAIMAAAIFATVNIFAQGTVNFSNIGGGGITNSLTGARVIVGTTFMVQLYYSPDQANAPADDLLMPLAGVANIGPIAGIYSAGVRTAPVTPPGASAWFQVRAWEAAFGTSYEAALANSQSVGGRLALVGKSNTFKVNTSDPTLIPPEAAANLVAAGLQGFLITPVVPEPSVIGLGLLGAGALLLLRRRK